MLDYMIYILAFAVGSILGLLYSYKKHGEPYVAVLIFLQLQYQLSAGVWHSMQAMSFWQLSDFS